MLACIASKYFPYACLCWFSHGSSAFDKPCPGRSPVLKYVFLSLGYSDFLSFCQAKDICLCIILLTPEFSSAQEKA
ncbi:hypothetical protein GCWU000342_02179 [Shuttleworthella satelles DSM 14600]|uniref:Uncharacterized protein n=1 Tax=Shuttleworthella satelles DSM 14600 TaxID=626523 RepID=C4GDK6_9FIRM|nr:hypothetical protein GCWU000342_02179 [Shuttleworthia satelles DSM 14600]